MEIRIYEWLAKPLIDIIDIGLITLISAMVLLAVMISLYDFVIAIFRHQDGKQIIVMKMIKYSFFIGVLTQYKKVKEVLFEGFLSFASVFTESEIKTENITDSIIHVSLKNLNVMFNETNILATPDNLVDILFVIIVYVLCLFLLVFVLYKVLQAILQFHIVLTLAIIYIPCFIFEGVISVGEKFLNAVFSAGLKLITVIIIQQICIGIIAGQTIETIKKEGFWSAVTFGFLAKIDLSQIVIFLTVFTVCAFLIYCYDKIVSFLIGRSIETLTIGSMIAEGNKILGKASVAKNLISKVGGK